MDDGPVCVHVDVSVAFGWIRPVSDAVLLLNIDSRQSN